MNEDGHLGSAVLGVGGGDHMDVGVSSSSSCSSSPALRVPQGDTTVVMDHCSGDEEKNLPTDTPDYSISDSRSPAPRQSPTLIDVHSSKPTTSISPQQPLPDSLSLSTSQHNPAAVYQPAVEEEESCSKESQEQQPLHPHAPKVNMSLRDFALRKKKQREEEMTKNVQMITHRRQVLIDRLVEAKVDAVRMEFR